MTQGGSKATDRGPTPEEIAKAVSGLTPGTLEVFFELLLGGIEVEPDPEIEAAWLEEVSRRLRDFDEGRTESIPAEEVFARVGALPREPRAEPETIRVGAYRLTMGELIDAAIALPAEMRVALAEKCLATLESPSGTDANTEWRRDSERWLANAKRALERAARAEEDARREDEEDLVDMRDARREIEAKGTIPWEEVKRELGIE